MERQTACLRSSSNPSVQTDLSNYIDHTVHGHSIRALARASGVHPSTIMRRVRKLENRREDPLVDEAIEKISVPATTRSTGDNMNAMPNNPPTEILECLGCLDDTGAFLALASDMENAVIMRKMSDGTLQRGKIVARAEAQQLALNEWIEITQNGRITKYVLSAKGRAALNRMRAAQADPNGFEEAPTGFAHKRPAWGHRVEITDAGMRVHRTTASESPLVLLSRRKGKDGKPFLSAELVSVGEQLRQDFELSQAEPGLTQNWDAFLTGPIQGSGAGRDPSQGVSAAMTRFRAAMQALGPGLSEIALHCCCYQKGVETAEKSMGWSARSGKIVLRIALQRLKLHYQDSLGQYGPMIG